MVAVVDVISGQSVDVVSRNDLVAVPSAALEEAAAEPCNFSRCQLQPDRAHRVAEWTTLPHWAGDAERSEQAGSQEVPQVLA